MITVEMSGRMFEVANLLTQADIPFNIQKLIAPTSWGLAIKPPFNQDVTWTICENPGFSHLSVRGKDGEGFITDIGPEKDPLKCLADEAAFFIYRDGMRWDYDEAWKKLFLKYKIIEAKVSTTYLYIQR